MHIRRTHLLIGALASAVLSACGGGGGGGGATPTTPTGNESTTPTPPVQAAADTPITITNANASQTAGLGHIVVSNTVNLGGQTSNLLVGAETNSESAMTPPGLLSISFKMLDTATQAWEQPPAELATGATRLNVVRCAQSGTSSTKVVAKSLNEINVGDQITVEYKDCVESGFTFSGRVDMVIDGVSGSSPFDQGIKASITFSQLGAIYGGSYGATFNGKVQAYRFGQNALLSGWVKSDGMQIDYLRESKTGSMKFAPLDIKFEAAGSNIQYDISGDVSADFPTVKGKLNIATSTKLAQSENGVLTDGHIKFSGKTGHQKLNYRPAYRLDMPDLEVQSDFNDDGSVDLSESVSLGTLLDRLW